MKPKRHMSEIVHVKCKLSFKSITKPYNFTKKQKQTTKKNITGNNLPEFMQRHTETVFR